MDHSVRSKGIGGSEVAAIVGLDEFSSPYKVWLQKTGREVFSVDNKYTQAGVILESAVSEFFESKTKYKVIKSSDKQETYFHPKHTFAFGTPDRRYYGAVGKGILECKTTQRSFEEVPEKWFIQLQWYLGIMGLMYGSVAWLERGLDFKYREFEFDQDFFEYLVEAAGKFWNENVLKDIAPDPINVTDVLAMYPKHRDGEIVVASPELITNITELSETKEAIKQLKEREEEIENIVKLAMGGAEILSDGINPLVTWKASKSSVKFDTEAFKAVHPDIYSQFLKEIPGSRRFLLK